MLFTGARIVGSTGVIPDGWLRVAEGVVADLGEGSPTRAAGRSAAEPRFDLGGRWLGPGFIDMHIHGAAGADVMDGTPEAIRTIARAAARHGITSIVPTTYTATEAETLRALRAIRDAEGPVDDGATVLGAHMEGPFLSARRKGAHREELLRPGTMREARRYLREGHVLALALAPEVGRNAELIPRLVEEGVVVSLGHTDARAPELFAAAGAGARLVTHLFNGMRPLHHRDAGAVGAALLSQLLSCELIADGVHVDRETMRIAWRLKGAGGLILVSDAGRLAGAGTRSGDAMYLPDGTLASGVAMLSDGFRTFCAANDLDLAQAWPVASGNAARLLGLSGKGEVRVGADADLTILEPDGTIAGAVAGGRLVLRAF